MKRVLAVVCLVISLGVLQGHGKSFEGFFRSNNNYPYRTLLKCAHPMNNFVSGECYVYEDYIKLFLWSRGGLSEKLYKTDIKLYLKHSVFSRLVVTYDTDPAPAFLVAAVGKEILAYILRDFQSDTVEYLEKLYGKRIRNMDVEEICTLYLSLMLLSY